MGSYDVQQVCLKGHQVTDSYHQSPEFRRAHCASCGAKTIHSCQQCNTEIKGRYNVPGVFAFGRTTVPRFCEACGEKYPWSDLPALDEGVAESDAVTRLDPALSIERICSRVSLVVRQLRHRHENRTTLDVADEYDLQDLLHSLLHLFFDDVRPEEYSPSYAGKASRVDFLLKNESIVVEAKMTRSGLAEKQVGEQLIVDIARYKSHPNCKTLICLVYDPDHRIRNPRGIESDLSRVSDGLDVRVFIVPRGT